MTVTKAKLFKTAVVSSDNSVIPQGTYVAVKYLRGTELKHFECTTPCGTTVVLNEYELKGFVL